MRLLALALIAILLLGTRFPKAESPPRMMTDSEEYCNHLNGEMSRLRNRYPTPTREVRELADEGRRMCDKGQYRGGVARLRRALMLMKSAP